MIGLLSPLPLPQVLQDKIIAAELEYTKAQSDYFRKLVSVDKRATEPDVYIPVIEPAESTLAAIFIEPGAAHFVFLDEVAPNRSLNDRYRSEREKIFGRVADVESIEIVANEFGARSGALFKNNYSSIQPYETSMHFATVLPYDGVIYSNTWNHMLSTDSCLFISIRGGYKKATVEILEGGRSAAEEWAKDL